MGLKDRITGLFSSEKEQLEFSYREAPEKFRERKTSELEKAENRKNELVDRSRELSKEIEESLDEIKGYRDSEDLDVVEDVAENFYQSRKRLLEDLNLSDDIEKHLEDLQDFLEDFNDVTRKEGAVMKRVEKNSENLSRALQKTVEHRDKVENFLEKDYKHVKKLDEVKQEVNEIEEKESSIKELEKELEETDTVEIEERVEDLEKKIEDLKNSEEWKEKNSLKSKKQKLQEEKDEKISRINTDISKLERGLKKTIYAVENSEPGFEGDLSKLKGLKDHSFRENTSVTEELREAEKIVEKEDLLGERQLEKFSSTVKEFSDLDSRVQKISVLEEEISEVEEKLSEFELDSRLEKLEKKLTSARKDLERKKDEINSTREDIENMKDVKQESLENLEKALSHELNAEVELKEED